MMKRDYISAYNRLSELSDEFDDKISIRYEGEKIRKITNDRIEYIVHESAAIISSKEGLENILFLGKSASYIERFKLTKIYEKQSYKTYMTEYLPKLKTHIAFLKEIENDDIKMLKSRHER